MLEDLFASLHRHLSWGAGAPSDISNDHFNEPSRLEEEHAHYDQSDPADQGEVQASLWQLHARRTGRVRAGSRTRGKFVAAMTMTP